MLSFYNVRRQQRFKSGWSKICDLGIPLHLKYIAQHITANYFLIYPSVIEKWKAVGECHHSETWAKGQGMGHAFVLLSTKILIQMLKHFIVQSAV
jgi:hypothetical protein